MVLPVFIMIYKLVNLNENRVLTRAERSWKFFLFLTNIAIAL